MSILENIVRKSVWEFIAVLVCCHGAVVVVNVRGSHTIKGVGAGALRGREKRRSGECPSLENALDVTRT